MRRDRTNAHGSQPVGWVSLALPREGERPMTRMQSSTLAVCVWTAFALPRIVTAQPACTNDCFIWKQRTVGPEARTGHAMIYDELRESLVLFGGSSWDAFGDTWERRDGEWQLRDCSGPAPRSGHAMVYDSIRGVTLLFGGYGNGAYFGDTWEWDGLSWTLVSESGPASRSGHAMAFDRDRGRVVLFGGSDGDHALADTWEWDGTAWTLREAPGPSPRSGHVLSYDERRGVSVMYAGAYYADDSQAVWEWDGTQWRRSDRSAELSSPYPYGVMIYNTMRETSLFLAEEWCEGPCSFGSCSGPCLQAWEWNGTEWTHNQDRDLAWGPYGTAAAYDRALGVTRVFGGYTWGEQTATYVKSDDFWGLNPDGWIRVESGAPAQRWGHAMAFDEYRGVTVLFGGFGTNVDPVGPVTWEWNGSQWSSRTAWGPTARHGHAMAFDLERGATLLFGGGLYSTFYDSMLWEWNGRSWFPRAASGPSPRANHTMVFDSHRRVTVLFGGRNNEGPLGDTWEWDRNAWVLRASTGPEPRSAHAMAYDADRGVTVLFGGVGWDRPLGDTWEWDGSQWTLKSQSGPSPRTNASMVYDSANHRSILFGGEEYGYNLALGDTWAWDGSSWTLLATLGPTPRWAQAMTFDSARNKVVLFGGQEGYPILADTWELDVTFSGDKDQDGVLDECDQCTDTPQGYLTLQSGCMVADVDDDTDSDLVDFQTLQNCWGWGFPLEVCFRFDLNKDEWTYPDELMQLISPLTGPTEPSE